MIDDPDRCFAAVRARDRRFDGWFTFGVTTTGIHCRPSCPSRTPRRDHVRFFATTAGAAAAGFRACKRCVPDAAPGSPDAERGGDLPARALRAIADGVVDRDGVAGLASQLACSPRHLHRTLVAAVGAGPAQLARTQRARTARTLIEGTSVAFTDVAFAAGYGSIRQFNDAIRARYGASPSQLRDGAARRGPMATGSEVVTLRLATREPFDGPGLLAHLAARAVPGVEEAGPGWHRRALTLPRGAAVATLTPVRDAVQVVLDLEDPRDLVAAVARLRRLADLDADPLAVDAHLAEDAVLAHLVAATPGRRVPAAADPDEAVLRAVLGQQVSLAAASTLAGRIVARCGTPLRRPHGAVTHRLPDAAALADADLEGVGLPGRRSATLRRLAHALASGALDLGPGADRGTARAALAAVPGVGPWTLEVLALRALHDPDAFPATDLALRAAAQTLGLPSTPAALAERSQRWGPWRAHAAQHLWAVAAARRAAA